MQTPGALRLVALAVTALILAMATNAQLVGSNTAETHPALMTQTCTKSGCTDEDTSIVLDANWRWLYKEGTSTNCYTGNTWDKTICSDPKTCASSCALDGADYPGTYGITSESNSLSLKLVTKGPYNLNCGLNGVLYFVDMDTDGGRQRFSGNKAGAKFTVMPKILKIPSLSMARLTCLTGQPVPLIAIPIQGGETNEMPYSTWSGLKDKSSLTDSQCSAAKKVFGDKDDHKIKGGLAQLMKRGMVLTMSLWLDHESKWLWLDLDYPVAADAKKAGVTRATCAKTSGDPGTVVSEQADATIFFSNIRFGDIGATVDGISTDSSSGTSSTTKTSTSGSLSSSATTSAPSPSTSLSGSTTTDPSNSTATKKQISTTPTMASSETSSDSDNATASPVVSESSRIPASRPRQWTLALLPAAYRQPKTLQPV
ncbi:unnamed protein product [Phytophthora fragariaefolia]|uniref:cellulose 1,4-beta-cellobiosidase (non-reducing end) n=1 Tax=Phytophthora fragariaefolia TaxID=1490495 RepID=A0A9W6YEN1_9STRA|nr:unnamed protein product [Phytophthora fragariaefolia]